MALAIVEKISSDMIAHKVARELVVYLRRSGNDAQQSAFMKHRNHIHSGIHKAQDFIQENIKVKVPLDLLAEKACMSTRNLTRVFKKETGVTVNEYTNLIRREILKSLTTNPVMKRKQIAQHLGLKSERQVSRLLYS